MPSAAKGNLKLGFVCFVSIVYILWLIVLILLLIYTMLVCVFCSLSFIVMKLDCELGMLSLYALLHVIQFQ